MLTSANWNVDPNAIRTSDYELIETRLMVRQKDGWDALPYVWDGDDAYLSITGAIRPMTLSSGEPLNYLVPSKNQCATCHATNHTTGELMPIGIKARHLDRTTALYNKNQLDHLAERGWLDGVSRTTEQMRSGVILANHLNIEPAAIWTSIVGTVTTRKVLRTRRACCSIMRIIRRVPWACANRPSQREGGQADICTE